MNNSIDKQLKWLKFGLIMSILGIVGLSLWISTMKSPAVIRAQGIVITDSLGNDRILIGSPIPNSSNRMRTDLTRVEKEWASKMGGDSYMKRYKEELSHGFSGIVFINDKGYDKLLLGENLPDPNVGKRMVAPSGFTFNDDLGYELGGLGTSLTESGENRIVFGMDDSNGEALHLFVLEDGTKGMQIVHKNGRVLYGYSPENGFFNNSVEFAGIKMETREGKTLWEQNALKSKDE